MNSTWHDINWPGGLIKSRKSEPEKKPAVEEVSIETTVSPSTDESPEVRLSEPEFIRPDDGFQQNKPCTIRVKVEMIKPTMKKKITFDVFSWYNGVKETVYTGLTGYIEEDGYAKAEIPRLYWNETYLEDVKKGKTGTFEYEFTARHSVGKVEITSPRLTLPENENTEGVIESVAWEKRYVIAWDSSDKPEMKARVIVVTKNMPAQTSATASVYQYDGGGNHTLYKKYENLTFRGNKLYNADGTELECRIEWHDTIYDMGRTQYFITVEINGITGSSEQTSEALLQLKYYNGIIGNPSGDLPGATKESNWVYSYMTKHGRWKDAVQQKVLSDGHKVRYLNSVGKASMKILVESNKFIHHQSSHGTAYCTCNGTKNYVQDSGVAGADGYNDYYCPVCNTFNNAVGCIFLKDWSNLFFSTDVAKLERSPKILVFANCCLTAITGAYPRAWLKKGTRWYIGWGLPVADDDAVSFAKAFYKRWMSRYEMNPDDVKKAFNDVKGAYMQYRPRIYGK